MKTTSHSKFRAHASMLFTLFVWGVLSPIRSAAGLTSAQTSAGTAMSAQTSAPDTALRHHPINIEDSQPDPHEEYLLGGGDEIVISITGRPELSGAHVVGPDGRITLPVVGTVLVGEKNRDDAAKAIDAAVGKSYNGSITSTVEVTKYGSNHIILTGAIEKQGVITFDQPPTLLEAIARGGPVYNADKTVQPARKCIIYRGDDQVMNVNISERFDGQKALNNIRLRRNDIIYFPENQGSVISVLGEVGHPGPVPLIQRSTLVTLLAAAGGITEKAGGNPKITITESSTGRIQVIGFKDLLNPNGGSDIALHDGDIVYVPRSGLAKTGFFFQQISPITGLGSAFALSGR